MTEQPTCTCLSISRDPLCVYHGDIDKVASCERMKKRPKRSALGLVESLRSRADFISGQVWEAPATADMMREAADCIQKLTAAATGLYLAGRWECAAVPPERAAALWADLRDALGFPEGTATDLGIGDQPKRHDE